MAEENKDPGALSALQAKVSAEVTQVFGEPAVALLDFENVSGTASIKFTLRCKPGQDETDLLVRAKQLIQYVDPGADVAFKFKSPTPAYRGNYSGNGGGSKGTHNIIPIPGDQFTPVAFERIERPNKKDPDKGPWYLLRVHGALESGEKFYADTFVGNETWVAPNETNPAAASGLFPSFKQWPVGKLQDAARLDRDVVVKVKKTKFGYDVADIVVDGVSSLNPSSL